MTLRCIKSRKVWS